MAEARSRIFFRFFRDLRSSALTSDAPESRLLLVVDESQPLREVARWLGEAGRLGSRLTAAEASLDSKGVASAGVLPPPHVRPSH